jgi:hypothetical protein
MIPGRLRECLKILRWKPADLAEQLGCSEIDVRAWLDGRTSAPIAVAAWLEALVKAFRALPPPGLHRPESTSNVRPIKLANVEAATSAIRDPGLDGIMVQTAYPHRTARFRAAGARPAPMHGQRKGASGHEPRPL